MLLDVFTAVSLPFELFCSVKGAVNRTPAIVLK